MTANYLVITRKIVSCQIHVHSSRNMTIPFAMQAANNHIKIVVRGSRLKAQGN